MAKVGCRDYFNLAAADPGLIPKRRAAPKPDGIPAAVLSRYRRQPSAPQHFGSGNVPRATFVALQKDHVQAA